MFTILMHLFTFLIANSSTATYHPAKFVNADSFANWVNERLYYPEYAVENYIQGKVTISFVVETNGYLSNIKVLEGVHPTIDQEVIRVVSMSPKWIPAKYNGKSIKIEYIFSVNFKITNENT